MATALVICRKCATLATAGDEFCPGCGARLLRRSDNAVEAPANPVCPYCHTAPSPGERVVMCERCALLHHYDCGEENEGCATYGCGQEIEGDESEPRYSRKGIWDTDRRLLWTDVVVVLLCLVAIGILVALSLR